MSRPQIIMIDFDGTIVEHAFPKIGDPLPLAFETLRSLKDAGYKLILWTCREDEGNFISRQFLTDAVKFCMSHGVEFDAVNESIPELEFRPERGVNRKPYADIIIDDRNFGGFSGWAAIADTLLVQDTIDVP